ncbi:MAG: hypothetical protein ACI9YH_003116 [Colwellia sp.]|jgi:hypothetical protein
MAADLTQSTHTIINQHNNDADNIARDKIVNIYQDIAPKSLLPPIEKILNFVKNKEVDSALLLLDTLRTMGNLDSDALALLDIISVRINLIKQTEIDDAYQTLTNFYRSKPEGLAADLCIGTLIRLDVANEKIENAKERYHQISLAEIYAKEAYFELLADSTELENTYNKTRLYLTEIDLCSLVRGGLRLKSFSLTIKIAEQLVEQYPSFNSRVLLVIAKAADLNDKLGKVHYWFISYQLKHDLESLIQELIPLVEESNGNDERLIPIIASILHYSMGQSDELHKLCVKYINKIEKSSPEVAKLIKLSDDETITTATTTEDRILKANKEPLYRKELIDGIISKNEITLEDGAVLATVGDKPSISTWLSNNPKILCDDKFAEEFILLELKAHVCSSDAGKKPEFEYLFNSFISSHEKSLANVNPHRIHEFANKLVAIELSPFAIKLLSIYINVDDPWPSPPVKLFLNSLYESDQLHSLNSILFNIHDNACDFYTWQMRAILYVNNGNLPPAILAFKKALKLNSQSIECWYNLVSILKQEKVNEDKLIETINEIPLELLDKPSQLTASILNEACFLGLFHKVEETMLNWFIQDSASNSILFTNLFTSITTFNKNPKKEVIPRLNTPSGNSAYTYLVDTKESTKIITRADVKATGHMLSYNSPIGSTLLNMCEGQVETVGTQKITLLKQVPPVVAAYQISLKLRHEANDGSDCFDMFEASEDTNELIEQMKSKMQAGNEDREFIASHAVLPLTMKCKRLGSTSPVDTALQTMTSSEVVKHPLFNSGINADKSIVLDTFSILHLALTGLYKSSILNNYRFYITEDTLQYFDHWFEKINDPDYMVAGVNSEGQFYRVVKEDIQVQTKNVQVGINFILDKAEVQKANIVDLPPSLLKIKDLICHSVYSSITLSIANDIPWLCVDGQLAQLYSALGLSSINAQQFLKNLADSTDFEDKKHGIYYYIDAGLPYPLTYEEMFQLSESSEYVDFFYLAELLNKNPNVFQKSEDASQFAYKVLIPVLNKGYLDGEMLHGARVDNIHNNGLVERIFHSCCRMSIAPQDGKVAEEKLAKLVVALTFSSHKIPKLRKLIFALFSEFISGHFLNLDAVNHFSEIHLKSINFKPDDQ